MILTKRVLLISFLFLSCSAWSNTYEDEIIFYEEFTPLKNEKETAEFSQYYQIIVEENEPDTLGWKFFQAKDKVIAILRWKNSQAIVRHLENVSEGGALEADFMAFNVLKLKNDKWKSYEDSEINGTKTIGANDLRVGWDFGRRIDDYGTDISHTHITVDWYESHADFLKSFMGTNVSDASKAYQAMLKLRDLKYRVLLKKHKSLR